MHTENTRTPRSTYTDRFEAIVAIAADAIISIDESHNITLFNEGAAEIFGYQPQEVVGQPLDILIPHRFRAGHGGHIRDFAGSDTVSRRMGERREIYGLRRDGTEFPAEASISKVQVSGRMIFTVLLRDVSERKRLEEERLRLLELEREARLLAERAARLRDEVLGVVSHDLRNPLSVIAMCAQGLESNEDNGRTAVRELSDTIKEATNWMQHLIKDLLDVASIEAGKLSLERKSCNVVISIVRSIDMLEPLASQASVSLLTDIPDDLPNVNADSDRIIQVLVNLIGNAIKFSGAERNVKVRAETSGDEVVITIVDSGPGIPADELDNVFERFWKSRRGSGASGTGLGLAIARGIVDAHRGRIWVDSVVGEGSQFHFTLPVAARTR